MTSPLTPVVPSPTSGVDGRVALATALHAAPGVYAVLVGSGMSSAAGVPTGWQVVQDLVRNIALADGVDPAEVEHHPERWWAAHGHSDPRYDTLLTALAPTDAARQGLLRRYFESRPDGTQIEPTEGHHALAALVATGRVRVIITTNFDRLIERALDQAGVAPQVVSTPSAVAGMTPLVHAPATVIKLHGDYLSLGLRNTPDELAAYPDEWKALLARVFDDYGLVVVGWSAEYDTALVNAMEASPSRRYPTYWATLRGDVSEVGRKLIAQRKACQVDTLGADDLFSDLVKKLERLERVARRRESPVTLRRVLHAFEAGLVPGWSNFPLLHLRVVVSLDIPSDDLPRYIFADTREKLLATINGSQFHRRILQLVEYTPAPAPGASAPAYAGLSRHFSATWRLAEDARQAADMCSFAFGARGEDGVSALIQLAAGDAMHPNSVTLAAHVGLSLATALRMADAARVLSDALILVTASLPDALTSELPGDATPAQVTIHFVAGHQVRNANSMDQRANDWSDRLDWASFGQMTRPLTEELGASARIASALTDRDARRLVCDLIEYIAYSAGFADPRFPMRLLREELNVSDT